MVSNVVITGKIEKTISQINHRYVASTTNISFSYQIFCCKIKIAEKIKWLFAFGFDWNIISLLRVKKSNNVCYVQAAKIVKSKDASCQKIKSRLQWPIFTHFCLISPLQRKPKIDLKLVHWFPFYLSWTYIFLAKKFGNNHFNCNFFSEIFL